VVAFSTVAMAQDPEGAAYGISINCGSPIYPGSGTVPVTFQLLITTDNTGGNKIAAAEAPIRMTGANIVSVDTTVAAAYAGSVFAAFNIISVSKQINPDPTVSPFEVNYGAVTFAAGLTAVTNGLYAVITLNVNDTGTICFDTATASGSGLQPNFVTELAVGYGADWGGQVCCSVGEYQPQGVDVECGPDRETFAGTPFNHTVTANDLDLGSGTCENLVSNEFQFLDALLNPSAPVNTAPCGSATLSNNGMPGPNVNNTFNWNTTGCAGGIYYVVFTYTDECGDVGADTCKYEIKTACAFVKIGETEGDPGQTINLPVLLTPTGADIGGFDFCIEFNNTELTAISVSRGNLIDDIEQASGKHAWHYFTYRLNPSTVIHKFKVCVIGIGRLYHYSDGMCIPQSDQEDTLFTIKFVLVNNQLFRCFWTPVIFEWDAWTCMENTLSDCTGNEVYVSDDPALYDPQECGLGEKNDIIPCVNFSDGAVIFRCPEDVDPVVIGDVNVNGSPYEIGDAVLFASYFLDGLSVFSNDNDTRQAQIGGTDINRDGYVLTVADLVYLLRILAGDQEPLGEGTSQSTAVAKVNYDGRNVKVETPEALGAIWVIFKGEGKVIDMSGENLTLQWKAANGETKVLVYGKIGSKNASIKTSDLFAVKGELELSRVEAATFQGSPIKVELTGKGILPSEFKLLQNFPNPFNATTQISFALPKDGNVSLKIYNVAGQLVKTYDSFMTAGYRTITWDGTNKSGDDVASGVYFYNLKAEEFTKTLKMTLLK
jgi:hypothetical protein